MTVDPPVSAPDHHKDGGKKILCTCTIQREARDIHDFCKDPRNLAMVMDNVISVTATRPPLTHWVVKGTGESTVEWDTEVINQVPDQLIAWRTIGHPAVDHAGSLRFQPAPDGRGTEVRVTIEYYPSGGKSAEWGAKLMHADPAEQVKRDLARLKAYLETDEMPAACPATETEREAR